jgi:hypothetical protein
MLTRICLGLALLVAMPLWSQVEPSATGPAPTSGDPMQTPPPVSGESYPTATGSETRSNELSGGLSFETAYDDNVLNTANGTQIADFSYSIRPTIAFDQTTGRLHNTFSYSPGFTFYHQTSARNEADQSASAKSQYRLSPHISLSLLDMFQKSTNVFNQPFGGVSGSTSAPVDAVIAPFASQLGNTANASLSYQFSRNGMVGGGGSSSIVNYLNPAQAPGIPNSNSRSGSGFYNLRLSSNQYIGINYQYSWTISSGASGGSETKVESIYSFYTLYLKHALSLSVSGGPQHFDVTQPSIPESASWTPAVDASMSWQSSHSSISASYSRTVSGAGGLVGAFKTSTASASVRQQWTRTWTTGCAVSYSIETNVVPAIFGSSPGGHTISGSASIEHQITERLSAEAGYARLNQAYTGIAVISANPDSDREYISISYHFARPLGR